MEEFVSSIIQSLLSFLCQALIISIIVCIVLINENSKLRKENKKLKEDLQKNKNADFPTQKSERATNQNVAQPAYSNSYVDNANLTNRVLAKEIKTKKETMKKEQNKNVMILVAGATLIALSALVFLMTTWNVIPNIFKTIVLTLLIGVFFGASSIAEKKLKLKQTAATFYYLAMAYIPIMLISIWGFGLLGNYLSIYGEGRYIYLAIMSIVVSIIYFNESKKKKGIVLLIFYSFFQLLAVIFSVLIFTNKSRFVWFGLTVYSLINATTLFNIKNNRYRKYFKNYSNILVAGVMMGVVFTTIGKWIMSKCELIHVINFALLAINFVVMMNNKKMYKDSTIVLLNELRNLAVLMLTISLVNIQGIVLISGTRLFVFSMVAFLVYMIDYMKYGKIVFKIIEYVLMYFIILSIFILLDITEYSKYIPIISTLLATISEKIKRDESIKYYILISYIISFIALNIGPNMASFIVLLISIGAYYIYVTNNDVDESWNIVPSIALFPYALISDVLVINNGKFDFRIILSMCIILWKTFKSLKNQKLNQDTIISFVYILASVICFAMNKYIEVMIFVLWSTLHIAIHNNKKIYQPVLFSALLGLYLLVIEDLKINKLVFTNLIGVIIFTLAITRITISENKSIQKVSEYIAMAIIYLIAMDKYKSIADAMLSMCIMFGLIVMGYLCKFGPLFLSSLIAIVLNGIKLTENFWKSIPWWAYLLLVGIALILFAVNNEVNQKENQRSFIGKIKKIKQDINM